MNSPNVAAIDEIGSVPANQRGNPSLMRTSASVVSWGAILAGATAAAALSLILLILGTGLGLSTVSPWTNNGISATTFGVSTILWITFTQLAAAGLGGYLAGRLRTRWIAAHTDEVYFRDTAHGFLTWAVATIFTAALLTSVIGSIVSGGIKTGATVVGGVGATVATGMAATSTEMAKSDNSSGPMGYFVDSLFRKDMTASINSTAPAGGSVSLSGTADSVSATPSPEVTRIFMNTVGTGALPVEDVRYIGQIVAQRTGLNQQDAEKRVSDTYARLKTKMQDTEVAAKDAADKARKASAYAALWLFVSLLLGAFVASFSATYGGRQRDV